MSDLRTLFPDSRYNIVYDTNTFSQFSVCSTTIDQNNGGKCCLWTVPANAKWARFEVWGGGGSGGGGCCCQLPVYSGGSGTYARKTIRVVPAEQYTICAGGSQCCTPSCGGCTGYASYVCNASATYPICLCAAGGYAGVNNCFYGFGSCCTQVSLICGCACGHDLAICGVSHGTHTGTCGYDSWGYAPEPTYIGGGNRISRDFCIGCYGNVTGHTTFPGGGGMGAIAVGSYFFQGGYGAAGLVLVTYK